MSLTCSLRSGIGSEVQGEPSTADARLLKSTTPHHRHTPNVHAPQGCCRFPTEDPVAEGACLRGTHQSSELHINQRDNPVPTEARPDLNCCSSELHNRPS